MHTYIYVCIYPIIPLQNIGLPQASSISLYSWHRFYSTPRSYKTPLASSSTILCYGIYTRGVKNSKVNYKIQYTYMYDLCQPRPCTADHVLTYLAFATVAIRHLNNHMLDHCQVPVLVFTLSNVVSIFTVMISYAFCLLPA
jgi:hypothetical protein